MSMEDIALDISKEIPKAISELFVDLRGNPVKIVFENNEFQIEKGE